MNKLNHNCARSFVMSGEAEKGRTFSKVPRDLHMYNFFVIVWHCITHLPCRWALRCLDTRHMRDFLFWYKYFLPIWNKSWNKFTEDAPAWKQWQREIFRLAKTLKEELGSKAGEQALEGTESSLFSHILCFVWKTHQLTVTEHVNKFRMRYMKCCLCYPSPG